MLTKKQKHMALVGGVITVLLVGSAASAYYVKQGKDVPTQAAITQQSEATRTVYVQPTAQPQPVALQPAAAPPCNDGNVVGMATGAVVGGILGNQVGKGKGKTVATIGGAAGGAYVGQKYIPTNGVTCR